MTSRRMLAVLALAVGAASGVQAAPSVTIYTRDLGFVREPRTLEVSRDTVRISDVPERIDFSSVRLAPQTGRVTRLAYRFDVASGDGLFETARGSRVRVTLPRDRVVEGTLVMADGAWVVVRENDGGLRTLSRASVEDVRLSSPRRLATRPELEAVLDGARGGRIEAELSYLTGGLSWSADHTVVRTGENQLTWSSAVTVENLTGRDYVDADLKLVAGEPRRVSAPPPMPYMERMVTAQAMAKDGGGADLSQQDFSEYHLYTLDRPATLRDRERQTLTMLETHTVQMTPRYLYKPSERRGVRVQYEMRNTRETGLGEPLPAGRVRFHERDADGDLQFTGETSIAHTAEGEKLTLEVGDAFDLVGERKEMANRRISDREREVQVEIKLRNRKKSPVTIQVEEVLGGDFEVTQKSHDFTRKDANTIAWSIPVATGREATLTYTARIRY